MGLFDRFKKIGIGFEEQPATIEQTESPAMSPERLKGRLERLRLALRDNPDRNDLQEEIDRLEAIRASYL